MEYMTLKKIIKIIKKAIIIALVIDIFLMFKHKEILSNNSIFSYFLQYYENSTDYYLSSQKKFPKAGHIMSSYKCNNGGTVVQNAAKRISYYGFSDNCTLYFDISPDGPADDTLLLLQKRNSDIYVSDTDPILTERPTGDEGLFATTDNYGVSYYWRGAATTNYVKFGSDSNNRVMYWRIIRINGDGSLRLLYDGSSAGWNGNIGKSAFNETEDDPAYVGYMYGTPGLTNSYEVLHTPTNSSTIKIKLETWYDDNILGKEFEKYITDTEFCYDKVLSSSSSSLFVQHKYAPYTRYTDSHTASLLCSQKNDRFTVSDTNHGNGKLTRPIGLITSDEAVFGGMAFGNSCSTYSSYLYRNYKYWTGSPFYYYSVNCAWAGNIEDSTCLDYSYVNKEYSVVPVINISQEAAKLFVGKGTQDDPFEISEAKNVVFKLQTLNPDIDYILQSPEFTDTYNLDTLNALYELRDDYGMSYYFRGGSPSNYIMFGDYYWRIVRINGDGSVRLIYDGDTPGEGSSIGESKFNNERNDNSYVGYMYGTPNSNNYDETHANINDSTIKQFLDNWYQENISSKPYEKYLADNLFCNDRNPGNTLYKLFSDSIGFYAPNSRRNDPDDAPPTFKCKGSLSSFTVSDTSHGNANLTYPIGLITLDEAITSGIHTFSSYNNNSSYLNRNNSYWTMSPCGFGDFISNTEDYATIFYIYNIVLNPGAPDNERQVIPVINISSEAIDTLTGSGTQSDPFIVH